MSTQKEPESLSDVVARRIVLFRKRRDMTREDLASRCRELGYPQLTGPALANIETGRRVVGGKRRRDVTVDELMVFARALRVPPALLLFPVGDEPLVPVTPGSPLAPWEATQWMVGESYHQGEEDQWNVPLFLFRAHERLRTERLEQLADDLFGPPDEEKAERRRWEKDGIWDQLKDLRAEIRRHGLTPPPTGDDLEDRWSLFLPPPRPRSACPRCAYANPSSRLASKWRIGYSWPMSDNDPIHSNETAMPDAWADLLEALNLIAQHPVPDMGPLYCSDDCLYVAADDKAFTGQELHRLNELGFIVRPDGGFRSDRFGSS